MNYRFGLAFEKWLAANVVSIRDGIQIYDKLDEVEMAKLDRKISADLDVFFTDLINDLKRLTTHRAQSKTVEEVGVKFPIAIIFEKWAVANVGQFHPVRISRRKGVSLYSFKSITKKLILHLGDDGQIMVAVNHEGQCFDILQDWDVLPVKTKKGFHCGLCRGRRRFFNSLEDLLIEHSFHSLCDFIKRNFRRGKRIVLTKYSGSTSAVITTKAPQGGAVSVPVVIGRNRRKT